jgi:hypothetical protein
MSAQHEYALLNCDLDDFGFSLQYVLIAIYGWSTIADELYYDHLCTSAFARVISMHGGNL